MVAPFVLAGTLAFHDGARGFVQRRETTGPDPRRTSTRMGFPDQFDDYQIIPWAILVQRLNEFDCEHAALRRPNRDPPVCVASPDVFFKMDWRRAIAISCGL
jgi:hypothetical protein